MHNSEFMETVLISRLTDLKDDEILEMSGKRKISKTQYILATQPNRIISGHMWPKCAVAASAKPSNRFLNTGIYMFHIIQKNLIITKILKNLNF